MKIRIIKSILSIYGAMVPGKEITVPEHIALNWIKNGIAVAIDDAGNEVELEPEPESEPRTEPEPEAKVKAEPKKRPAVIPDGMFWCDKCQSVHRLTSKVGQSHLGYSS